jgi:CRISPR-associated protein Csc1
MSTETAQVLPVTISPMDRLYYVSREPGSRFVTKPYMLHTALYYAFGVFPSRFRCVEQTPSYIGHRKNAGAIPYIHPATAMDEPEYETRRFSVKPDSYRSQAGSQNENLRQTGFQKTILPGTSYRTYAIAGTAAAADGAFDAFEERSTWYIRVGKKMTPALVETGALTEASIETGPFDLAQPVSTADIDTTDAYDLVGDLEWERMYPVDLLLRGRLRGPHVRVDRQTVHHFGRQGDSGTVSLPAEAGFLHTES